MYEVCTHAQTNAYIPLCACLSYVQGLGERRGGGGGGGVQGFRVLCCDGAMLRLHSSIQEDQSTPGCHSVAPSSHTASPANEVSAVMCLTQNKQGHCNRRQRSRALLQRQGPCQHVTMLLTKGHIHRQSLTTAKQKEKGKKTMPRGVTAGASVSRSSPRGITAQCHFGRRRVLQASAGQQQ